MICKFSDRSFLQLAAVGISLVVPLSTSPSIASCVLPEKGSVVTIPIENCQNIVAKKNQDVLQLARPHLDNWQKAYTGALINKTLMYPSSKENPCADFPAKTSREFKVYNTCCDTGRWGKCVFGGNWLTDLDAPPINAFQ